uniref:C-type lectin domain-containing protein n=1 Tax=Kryptolebias marmoratus TaxID=37003 RepID=A0A3Q2ZD73_KRYMA
ECTFLHFSILLCYFFGLHVLSTNMFREYHYVNSPKTWAEAQKFCREVYTDLAAADSEEENQRLRLATQGLGKFAWIGLYDDPRRWTWTVGDADFNSDEEFNNWRFDQPDIKNLSESCVVITHIGVCLAKDLSLTITRLLSFL